MTLLLTFSQSFFEQNVSVQLKLLRFLLFRNKARNAGRFCKNAGNKPTCGISRTIAGWLTPMILSIGSCTILFGNCECYELIKCTINYFWRIGFDLSSSGKYLCLKFQSQRVIFITKRMSNVLVLLCTPINIDFS